MPIFILYHTQQLTQSKSPNKIKAKTIKLVEENIGRYVSYPGVRKDFLDIDLLDVSKIENFYVSTYRIKKIHKQEADEKIFLNTYI